MENKNKKWFCRKIWLQKYNELVTCHHRYIPTQRWQATDMFSFKSVAYVQMFSVFGDFGQSQIFTVKIRGVLPSQEGKQLYVGAD